MLGPEPGVMSMSSNESEADLEDELRQLQPLPAPVSQVSTVLSLRWVESPSNYQAPAVAVSRFVSHFGAPLCDNGRIPAICRPIRAGCANT